jgi:putative PIG3 family NAD(P)H quinone oxidoreductase
MAPSAIRTLCETARMRAVVLHSHGGPEVLTIEDVDGPLPGPDEVVVDVAATALNRADLLQRMGLYPDPRKLQPEIPGLEFAGTVSAVGVRATMWRVGDRVMGIEAGGAYAEQIATHERQLLAVPASIDLVEAAAIPEVFLTAWDALVLQGGLTSGRWALVHAGGSGVGTAAIQIAKAIGARIAVTCSAGKADACRDLGADVVLERSPHDWLSDSKAAVPQGFDTVLDVIGGDEVDRNLQAVAVRGTIVQVGLMGGGTTPVNVGLLLGKRATWVGTTLRTRPLEEKIAVTRRFAAEVLPLFASGALRPVIDSIYPFDQIADAHRHMEANANTGKILVTIGSTHA